MGERYSGIMDGFKPHERMDRVNDHSPFAVGQLVNHPSRGTAPNVDWQEFLWEDRDEEVRVNRLHSGLWYLDPVTMEPVNMPAQGSAVRIPVPGIAIVALRDLEPGEELYMNYRFNPPYPAWYSPVDPSAG